MRHWIRKGLAVAVTGPTPAWYRTHKRWFWAVVIATVLPVTGPALTAFWFHNSPHLALWSTAHRIAILILPFAWLLLAWSTLFERPVGTRWVSLWQARVPLGIGLAGLIVLTVLTQSVLLLSDAAPQTVSLLVGGLGLMTLLWSLVMATWGLRHLFGRPTGPRPPMFRLLILRIVVSVVGAAFWAIAVLGGTALLPWPGLQALWITVVDGLGVAGLLWMTLSTLAAWWRPRWPDADRQWPDSHGLRDTLVQSAGLAGLMIVVWMFAPGFALVHDVPTFWKAQGETALGKSRWVYAVQGTSRMESAAAQEDALWQYQHRHWHKAEIAAQAALTFAPDSAQAGVIGGYSALRLHQSVASWLQALSNGGHFRTRNWLETWAVWITTHHWTPQSPIPVGTMAALPSWTPRADPTDPRGQYQLIQHQERYASGWALRDALPNPRDPTSPMSQLAGTALQGWFSGAAGEWQPDARSTYAAVRAAQDETLQNGSAELHWLPIALHHWNAVPTALKGPLIVSYAIARNLPAGNSGDSPTHALRGLPTLQLPKHSILAQWIAAYHLWATGRFTAADQQWSAMHTQLPTPLRGITAAYLSVAALETQRRAQIIQETRSAIHSGNPSAITVGWAVRAVNDSNSHAPNHVTLAAYREALRHNPTAYMLWYDAGQAALSAQDPALALKWFSTSSELYQEALKNPLAIAIGASWDQQGVFQPNQGDFGTIVQQAIGEALSALPVASNP